MERVDMQPADQEYRLDALAREAGVASTTVRLYQAKGLLHPPRLVGRTGWYDATHLDRLQLIARLQDDGFSLAGIARLLQQWESGGSLDALVNADEQLHAVMSADTVAVRLSPSDLAQRFPTASLTAELLARAVELGVVGFDGDDFVVPDGRFLDVGSQLASLGVPLEVVLAEWEVLIGHTDAIADRFAALAQTHLVPRLGEAAVDASTGVERLRELAKTALVSALDASLTRAARNRLSAIGGEPT